MKQIFSIALISSLIIIIFSSETKAQVSMQPMTMSEVGYPWKKTELIEPAALNEILKAGNKR